MNNEELADLRNELKTQSNRMTGNPLFIVEQEKRIYGMDGDLIDDLDFIWAYTEDYEYTYEPDEIIEAIRDSCEEDGTDTIAPFTLNLWDEEIDPEEWGYEQLFYVTEMEFKGAHFTERAADLYIAQNRHNLRNPRTYVTSQYRCHEWNMVRDHLMAPPTTKMLVTTSGGDWADASFDHAIIPGGLDVKAASKEYKAQGGYVKTGLWFVEWLCKHRGATEPSDEELEYFEEP